MRSSGSVTKQMDDSIVFTDYFARSITRQHVEGILLPLEALVHQVFPTFVHPDLAEGQDPKDDINACCNKAIVAHLIIQSINRL